MWNDRLARRAVRPILETLSKLYILACLSTALSVGNLALVVSDIKTSDNIMWYCQSSFLYQCGELLVVPRETGERIETCPYAVLH
jgi:hypothetical protein